MLCSKSASGVWKGVHGDVRVHIVGCGVSAGACVWHEVYVCTRVVGEK